MTKFTNMLKDDSGAAAAEYALILAIVGSGIAVAAWNLGNSIKGAMATAGSCITNSASVSGAKPVCG